MALPLDDIPTFAFVINEPELANVRGTIAMAKLSNSPNSATSQWFFNLADNTGNLDEQNGGFTVFGEVVGDGMEVVDAIAALPTFDFGGATQELPLQNFRQEDFDNDVPVGDNNLVIINMVQVSDSAVDSAAGLNPPLNTASQSSPPGGGSSGGGSLGFIGLLGLLLAVRRRVCAC
jgi:peptidyl-prolyl cis-trans isomerase A (cyclophilin A)